MNVLQNSVGTGNFRLERQVVGKKGCVINILRQKEIS